MIRKLGLGDNFPRKLLCVQKSYLGIGLIEPNTEIDMLAIKLCIGNKILQGKVYKLIAVQEELGFAYSGLTERDENQMQEKCTGTKDVQEKWEINRMLEKYKFKR